MKREARLQAARAWLPRFGGKEVIRSYARWFGVDWLCAIKELRLLGVPLSEARVQELEATLRNRRRRSRRSSLPVAEPAAETFETIWEEPPPIPSTDLLPPLEIAFDYDDATTPREPDDELPF